MTNLNPSMRMKVNRDTFFLPDPNGTVYFRNNVGSFRMEGAMMDQWIQKLLPMFNGEHTLTKLTDGLPDLYKNRIYEIAETLYQNGFVRDVSEDCEHELSNEIGKKYSSQIEFLDSLGGSGAYRFQCYRQAKVLAVGSGPFFVNLVSALLESGLPTFALLITKGARTNRERLEELIAHACVSDPQVALQEVSLHIGEVSNWSDVIQPFDFILYVSQEDNVEELRVLHAICRQENKVFVPAVILQQAGLVGPLVHPDSDGCWESAIRRLHESAISNDPQLHTYSSTAGAMLSNVTVFELFKLVTGVTKPGQNNQFYLLNLETLEGNWHGFEPHPLVTGSVASEWIQVNDILQQNSQLREHDELLAFFSYITSAQTGIFHLWEEGDLTQLPLAQCRVQAVEPLSDGPAKSLSQIVCNGLTHKEAAREAGLSGIEAYASRLASALVPSIEAKDYIGFGAGETAAEGVCRALQHYLEQQFHERQKHGNDHAFQVLLESVEDDRCRFYVQALTTLNGAAIVAVGEEVSGFPVVWVGISGNWYGTVGLNVTIALQKALQQALLREQNQTDHVGTQHGNLSPILLQQEVVSSIVISTCENTSHEELLHEALQVLKENHKRMDVLDLTLEPFWKQELAGVFGVLLREEESP